MHISKEKYFPIDTVLNVVPGETVRPTFHMISTLKPRVPMNTLIMAQVGYNPNQTTAGAMIGFGKKKNGFYIGFRSDFGSAKGDLVCDENGIIEGKNRSPVLQTGRKKAIRVCPSPERTRIGTVSRSHRLYTHSFRQRSLRHGMEGSADAIVTYSVKIPTNLTEAQKELFRQLQSMN